MTTYTVYLMDEEPSTRMCGEFGHIIAGVFDSFKFAKKVAEEYTSDYNNIIIMENNIFGLSGKPWGSIEHESKEVWRYCAANDILI